jgi:Anti-sigma-28 factor, FlgM
MDAGNPMTAEQEAKMAGIKQQIERGEYRVDPRAVADAIVRRLGDRSTMLGYKACSYPANSASRPPKPRPLAP